MLNLNSLKRSILLAASLSLVSAAAIAADWNYDLSDTVHGPNAWGTIEGYETCGTGQKQSPIDLNRAYRADISKIIFNYKEAALNVVNNGHTIQVNVDNGSTISIGKETYRLLQFHFHSPSEHTRYGYAYPMEVHFVHVNNAGTLAVVGVFIKQGRANEVIEAIWKLAPHEAGTVTSSETIKQRRLLGGYDTGEEYFNYHGSLTTPPCTENVRWHVLDDAIEASAEQIEHFKHLLHEGHNARPVQELNGRKVLVRDY